MPSNISPGTFCQKIAISSTSAQSTAINGSIVHVTPTTGCFMRRGSNPVAVSTGVDHYLVAGATQEFNISKGDLLAFITDAATGSVYVAVAG
jgi:hypothetical protein